MPAAGAVGIESSTDARDARDARVETEQRSESGPVWSVISDTIRCPLCRYDLRGLIEPRCPECGYRFNWPELLDPARRAHRFLFEQHPERNVRSFARTLIGHLLPRRFWRSIRPEQPVIVRRLILYWILLGVTVVTGLAIYAGASAAFWGVLCHRGRASALKQYPPPTNTNSSSWVAYQISIHGSYQAFIDAEYPDAFSARHFEMVGYDIGHNLQSNTAGLLAILALAALVWPWLTALAMLAAFRISLRRAKITAGHVVRIAVYSTDVYAWFVPIATVCVSFHYLQYLHLIPQMTWLSNLPMNGNWLVWPVNGTWLVWAGAGIFCVALYRLTIALKHYLKLDHALATAVAAQLIVAVAMVVTLMSIQPLLMWLLRCVEHV
jgi:hypothetical protein